MRVNSKCIFLFVKLWQFRHNTVLLVMFYQVKEYFKIIKLIFYSKIMHQKWNEEEFASKIAKINIRRILAKVI